MEHSPLFWVLDELRAYYVFRQQGYSKRDALYHAHVKIVERWVDDYSFDLWTP